MLLQVRLLHWVDLQSESWRDLELCSLSPAACRNMSLPGRIAAGGKVYLHTFYKRATPDYKTLPETSSLPCGQIARQRGHGTRQRRCREDLHGKARTAKDVCRDLSVKQHGKALCRVPVFCRASSTNKSRHAKFMFVAEGKTVPAVPE